MQRSEIKQPRAGIGRAEEVSVAKDPDLHALTRRERQIMEIIYQHGSATAVDVMEQLPGSPVNATVRTMLTVLEEKGYLRHERMKGKYVYYPTIPLQSARKTILDNVVDTFFKGAEAAAVISILKKKDANLTDRERRQILDLIEESRKGGR
jgi:BlaI family penicillinase repressor